MDFSENVFVPEVSLIMSQNFVDLTDYVPLTVFEILMVSIIKVTTLYI